MKWILSLSTLSLLFSLSACGAPSSENPAFPLPPKNYDTAGDVANPEGQRVDDYFSNYRELLRARADEGYPVDGCEPTLNDRSTFADRIAFAVEEGLKERKAELSYVASAFNLPSSKENFLANSFLSHPYCAVSASSLRATIGKNIPKAATIAKADRFSEQMNEYRRLAYRGDTQALLSAHRLWSRFMMCLAYTESLPRPTLNPREMWPPNTTCPSRMA